MPSESDERPIEQTINITVEKPEYEGATSSTAPRIEEERSAVPETKQPTPPVAQVVFVPVSATPAPPAQNAEVPRKRGANHAPAPEERQTEPLRIPEIAKSAPETPKPEEKASAPEVKPEKEISAKPGSGPETPKSGRTTKKLKVFGVRGRKHTEQDIDAILDIYLITLEKQGSGVLPLYVSERMQRNYKVHRRLEERRKVLERDGKITSAAGNL